VINEHGARDSEILNPIVLAHELRSHLAAISLGASHVRRRLESDDRHIWRSLEIIDRAVGRATELTTWVLAMSPEPLPSPESPLTDMDAPAQTRRRRASARPGIPSQSRPLDDLEVPRT